MKQPITSDTRDKLLPHYKNRAPSTRPVCVVERYIASSLRRIYLTIFTNMHRQSIIFEYLDNLFSNQQQSESDTLCHPMSPALLNAIEALTHQR